MRTTLHLIAIAVIAALAIPAASAQTVATVDGSEITKTQLDVFAISRTGQPVNETTRDDLISQLSDLFILSNEAINQGLSKDAEVIAQLELQRRSVLAQSAVQAYVEGNQVSEEIIRAEYDKQFANPNLLTQYKARHILLETEEAAKSVIAELDGGADFAELAKQKSTGPSGPQGGDLGWFDGSAMVPPFTAGVTALEKGKYSKAPVQTQFGWHVIFREDSRAAEPPAYDEVKDRIKQALEQRNFQKYFETLRSKAKLETK